MKRPLLLAISAGLLWRLASGVAYDAQAAQSPLVVRGTTDRHVYHLRHRASAGRIHTRCRDGARTSTISSHGHTRRSVGVCDRDGQADGVCTFALDAGCDPPLLCASQIEIVQVSAGVRRIITTAPIPHNYVVRCLRAR